MKRGKLIGLGILALAVAALPVVASAGFYTTFNNAALNGPYQFAASGTFNDANDDVGQISLNGILAFSGTGGVTLSPSGMVITVSENGSEISGTDEFQNTCTETLATTGTVSSYSVNSDGGGLLHVVFFNPGTAGSTCFNTNTATDVIDVIFHLSLSENFHGGTNVATSTTFDNLCLTGSSSGFSSIANCAALGQDSVESMSLNGTMVHQ